MAEELAQSINARGLHFKVGNAVLAEGELCEAVDQPGIAEAKPQYASLWPVKAWTRNRNALVESVNKMPDKRPAGTEQVRV